MTISAAANFWLSPPLQLELAEQTIHIWYVELEQSKSFVEQLLQTLSTEERSRAKRFYFERDRQHFIVGRGVLRDILGRYIGIKPHLLQFCYGAHGKPALLQLCGNDILTFNVSHSNSVALYAISRNRDIGIDVEYMRHLADALQIADNFFSVNERTMLRKIPEQQRSEAFFCCWTRKEAYVKALGSGLSQALDQFDVSLVPGEEAELLAVQGDAGALKRWRLYNVELPTNFAQYKAALVAENIGQNVELTGFWQWQKKGD